MQSWRYEILKMLAYVTLGFLANVLLERLRQRRVKLEHELGSPSTFSDIPPTVTFQHLVVRNTGNAPAQNVRVQMMAAVVERPGVEFKVMNDEPHGREVHGDTVSLVFPRLVAKDKLEIAFKAADPLADGFVVGIKSDEVLSSAPSGRNRSEVFGAWVTLAILGAAVAMAIVEVTRHFASRAVQRAAPTTLVASVAAEHAAYARGDSVRVRCALHNASSEVLRGVTTALRVPGVSLSYTQAYQEVPFLGADSTIAWTVSFATEPEMPVGKQPVSLTAWATYPPDLPHSKVTSEFRLE